MKLRKDRLLVLFVLFIFSGAACMAGAYNNVSPDKAREMIRSGGAELLLLDVRTFGEYKSDGHLKNSVLIPINLLESKLGEISAYKDRDIIVYCAVGGRSAKASGILSEKGFKKVYNMKGGIKEWKRLGYEVE
ncbi:MAG: rhodanese-like domain-containing protein [bacterium]|nr:rhodanese-like domain-containing protein [bacterium]